MAGAVGTIRQIQPRAICFLKREGLTRLEKLPPELKQLHTISSFRTQALRPRKTKECWQDRSSAQAPSLQLGSQGVRRVSRRLRCDQYRELWSPHNAGTCGVCRFSRADLGSRMRIRLSTGADARNMSALLWNQCRTEPIGNVIVRSAITANDGRPARKRCIAFVVQATKTKSWRTTRGYSEPLPDPRGQVNKAQNAPMSGFSFVGAGVTLGIQAVRPRTSRPRLFEGRSTGCSRRREHALGWKRSLFHRPRKRA